MNRDHWFWKYAYENKGVYIQGGIATLMVNLFALVIGFFVMVVYDRIIPSNELSDFIDNGLDTFVENSNNTSISRFIQYS